ncbi:hypothetical protein ABKV19_025371 [Rosa sericea]
MNGKMSSFSALEVEQDGTGSVRLCLKEGAFFVFEGIRIWCKSDIKSIKVRLGAIKKKRNAVLKYLKNNVADLLKIGLDINVYGRVELGAAQQVKKACLVL